MEPEIRIRYPNGLRLSVTRLRGPSPYPVLSQQKAVPSMVDLRDDHTEKVAYRFVKDDFLYTLHGDVPEQVISETVLQIFRNE